MSTFSIYNHFPNHAIYISILPNLGSTRTAKGVNYTTVPKNSSVNVPKSILIHSPNVIRIHILDDAGNSKHIQDYEIKGIINSLHIGMVTSRTIEPGTENDRLIGNAYQSGDTVGGVPWVTIHNLTKIPLHLPNIIVQPETKKRYLGKFHYGVPLGTYLNDTQGIFPPFQYLVPATDVIFGVVSDVEQPTYGGVQYQNFSTEMGDIQPSWVFEMGYQ